MMRDASLHGLACVLIIAAASGRSLHRPGI
jgi:hypothetical protein